MNGVLHIILLLFFSCNLVEAQDNNDRRLTKDPSTRHRVIGNYMFLPQIDIVPNQNTTVRKVHTNSGDVLISPNIRPFPQPVTTETQVIASVMSGNQNIMYASWNSINPTFYGTGFCFTSDGGANWSGSIQTIIPNNQGNPGTWIWPAGSTYAGRLGLTVLGGATGNFISSTYSTDNGTTWTPFVNAGGNYPDRNLSCVDDITGSPFFGRAYTVWTDFGGTYVNRIVGAYTSNGGVTWSGYQAVSPVPPAGHYMQGCDIAVGPGGVLYCVWATCLSSGQYSTEDYLGFAKSTDGGVTWPVSNYNVVDINGIRAPWVISNIKVNSFPRIAVDHSGGARNGWIYVILDEKFIAPARDSSDITLCRSTDGGTTWTHTLVNSDPPGRCNFEPSICVDQVNGMVAAGYYDMRNSVTPVQQYFVSYSNSGGNSWTDVQVSDHDFTLNNLWWQSGYFGDYTSIVSSNGKFWPFWMDNSSGVYNVWTCAVTPQTFVHDCFAGPFLGLPSMILVNTVINVKTRIGNNGSSNETSVPVKFFIDGVLINTTNKNLLPGQFDSVSNTWQAPSTPGTHQLMYVTALASDQNRSNDTIRITANVLNSYPALCPFVCNPPAVFSFISGSPGPAGDNTGMAVPIGFTFNYVGVDYSQVWICTNGFIIMGPTGSTSPNNDLCTTDPALLNMVAGFWDDLNTNRGGDIQYATQGTAPNRRFIVQFTHVAFQSGSSNVTFQIILYETYDAIDIVYGPSGNNDVASGSVGLIAAPGGPSNFSSVVPGIICGTTSASTTTCYNELLFNPPDGSFYRWCTGPFTGIINNLNSVPSVYSLSQNCPNPFNPATIINFGIPKAGIVKLVVYDILGRTVATLVDEFRQAGSYKTDFDGTNLASGIYFYRFESGDYVNMKKMVLIK